MRAEFDDDLARARRLEQPFRSAHHVVERGIIRHAGENDVGLRSDVRCAARRNPAGLLEFGKRAASIADDRKPALDQIDTDWQPDLSDSDETDLLHVQAPFREAY